MTLEHCGQQHSKATAGTPPQHVSHKIFPDKFATLQSPHCSTQFFLNSSSAAAIWLSTASQHKIGKHAAIERLT